MRLFTALVLLALPFVPVAGSDPPDRPPGYPLKLAPGEVPVPKDWPPPAYYGRVVGLTDKMVTLKLVRGLRIERIAFNPDGTEKWKQVYVQDNNQPPKVFVFADQLIPKANGRIAVQTGHRMADVRIGDEIHIGCYQGQGVEYCAGIQIYRRPGGRVPMAMNEEKIDPEHRWDTKRNAEQVREEKAIALMTRLGLRLLR
jgi:hypothetical protein